MNEDKINRRGLRDELEPLNPVTAELEVRHDSSDRGIGWPGVVALFIVCATIVALCAILNVPWSEVGK